METRSQIVARTRSPSQTRRIAACLGEACRAGDVIGLVGDLGAGKTCFAQGVARGLGIPEREVVSPTFTLVHHHLDRAPRRLALDHVDLYRLGDESEAAELGLRDGEILGGPGVAVVEWLDRFPGLHEDVLWVQLERVEGRPSERRVQAHAVGTNATALLAAWRSAIRLFSRAERRRAATRKTARAKNAQESPSGRRRTE